MSSSAKSPLHHLDEFLENRQKMNHLQKVLDKIEKCCSALDRHLNLADVVSDEGNYRSLIMLFGAPHIETGIQLILKVALSDYSHRSFTIRKPIENKRKIDFIYKSIGGWNQFDLVLSFLFKGKQNTHEHRSILLVNPLNSSHWNQIKEIPAGTLVTAYVKTRGQKLNRPQEKLALERLKSVFDLIQARKDLEQPEALPGVHVKPGKATQSHKKPATPKSSFHKGSSSSRSKKVDGPLSMSLEIKVNKMDTFIHAGNAHLIVTHLSDYSGRVELFVLRGDKVPVQLDSDSIWGAEIRNGETVVYEFYGPLPPDEFLKELSRKTNKYTQMDKVANE